MKTFAIKNRESRKTLVFLLSTTLLLSGASAREWHINPETGSDDNDGTAEAPLVTAQVAVNRAESGDVIHLHPENALYRQSIKLSNGQTGLTIEGNGVTLTGADPLKVEWESLGENLQRVKLPTPRWGRHLLVVNGKKVHMNRRSVHPKKFPPVEELKDGEFRWDDIDDKKGWLTLKGSTDNLEWAVRPNGIGTGGDLSDITVRNLNARHFLNDGFNIHGNARALYFENITGYENFDEGFSAHDTCEAWIKDSKFWKNENAIADVNMADTYYENCEFSNSDSVEVILFGGRHSLSNCRIIPNETSTAIDIRRGGHPKRKDLISTCHVTFRETVIEGENPRISYGPNSGVFHDESALAWLESSAFRRHSSARIAKNLYFSTVIGRDEKGDPVYAHGTGTISMERGQADRTLDLVNYSPVTNLENSSEIFTLHKPFPETNYPPEGNYYQGEEVAAQSLWRWILLLAPDMVILRDRPADRKLGEALEKEGRLFVNYLEEGAGNTMVIRTETEGPSEMRERAGRTPTEIATALSAHYGHKFSGSYIEALSMIARLRLGQEEEVRKIAADYVKNAKLPNNGGAIAGTLVFAQLDGEASHQRVIEVADLAFDKDGKPLEAMPTHSEMSDAVFMASPLLAEAGRLSGDSKYFDQCLKHFQFIRDLCLRDDGIYRHSPLDDAAWGRGNGFPALGLAMVLEVFPDDHPGRAEILTEFQNHMNALAPHQDHTGMWHQVIDHPESYAEFTCTNMISYAALRGIQNGWLDENEWEPRVWRAWSAIKSRIGTDSKTLVDVCTGTGKQKSLEDYFNRTAILGKDDRGGAMALLFSTEMMRWLSEE